MPSNVWSTSEGESKWVEFRGAGESRVGHLADFSFHPFFAAFLWGRGRSRLLTFSLIFDLLFSPCLYSLL